MRYEITKLSDLQVDSSFAGGMEYAVYRVTHSALGDGSEVRELLCLAPTDFIAQHIADALTAYPAATTNKRTYTFRRPVTGDK